MRVAPLAWAILPLLAAGCLDASAAPVSSASLRDVADGRAALWDRDAQLVSMTALDPGSGALAEVEEQLAQAESELDRGQDDGTLSSDDEARLRSGIAGLRAVLAAGGSAPGDGRAAVWTHSYMADGRDRAYAVVVDSQGVVDAREVPVPDDDDDEVLAVGDRPLRQWKVDSVQAARAAAEVDETFAALQQDPDTTAIMALVQDEDESEGEQNPMWILAIESHEETSGAIVFVDAINGTAVSFTDLLFDLFLGTRESGSEQGTFTAAIDATAQASFSLGKAHKHLAVRLEVTPPPVVPIGATVTGPDGSVTSWEVGPQAGVPARAFVVLDGVPAGEFLVDLDAPLAPYARWTVSWCTDGSAAMFFPTFAEPACSDLP